MTEMVYVKEGNDSVGVKEEFLEGEDPLMIKKGIITICKLKYILHNIYII